MYASDTCASGPITVGPTITLERTVARGSMRTRPSIRLPWAAGMDRIVLQAVQRQPVELEQVQRVAAVLTPAVDPHRVPAASLLSEPVGYALEVALLARRPSRGARPGEPVGPEQTHPGHAERDVAEVTRHPRQAASKGAIRSVCVFGSPACIITITSGQAPWTRCTSCSSGSAQQPAAIVDDARRAVDQRRGHLQRALDIDVRAPGDVPGALGRLTPSQGSSDSRTSLARSAEEATITSSAPASASASTT